MARGYFPGVLDRGRENRYDRERIQRGRKVCSIFKTITMLAAIRRFFIG